jgi:hypothetical protein
LPARLIELGFKPEHVRIPLAQLGQAPTGIAPTGNQIQAGTDSIGGAALFTIQPFALSLC